MNHLTSCKSRVDGKLQPGVDQEQHAIQASKLQAIGSLAAGIAHEINTPIQFIGDNVQYLKNSYDVLLGMIARLQQIWLDAMQGNNLAELNAGWEKAEQDADLEYNLGEIPLAIEQTLDGVQRVAQIVKAMKEFAHGNEDKMVNADINSMLESTLIVAKNEFKYVADVITEFDPDLPCLTCYRNELNQVFLNILVNAAHAIGDVIGSDGSNRGTIAIKTWSENGDIIVTISDTGTGIAKDIGDRIYDPFYTTKEVGKGTGQGLAIANAVVVKKHHGTLSYESTMGMGTMFRIRLPLKNA